MRPYPLRKVHDAVAAVSDLFALYLPRTSDLRQLAALVPAGQKIPVTHYCMHGASKVSQRKERERRSIPAPNTEVEPISLQTFEWYKNTRLRSADFWAHPSKVAKKWKTHG
jgi:hypothetical protein